MEKLINLILYAGLEKDQFSKLIPVIQLKNTKNIFNYSLAMVGYFLLSVLFTTLVAGYFRPICWIYLITAALMALSALFSRIAYKKEIASKWIHLLINYLFIGSVYAEGISLSCNYPDLMGASTTFYVVLIVLPMICMDMPIRMIIFQLMAAAVFVITGTIYKSPEVAQFEAKNFWFFLIISLLVIVFVSSIRIKELMHGLRVEYLSDHDVLTGVKNRNCFEKNLASMEKTKINNLFFIYADVNELHELNNSQGHKAGDIMLQTVADGLKQSFTEEKTYRIGGDEFVAYTKDMNRAELEKTILELGKTLVMKGYHVSFGIAGTDEPHSTMNDVLVNAEKRMYDAKRRYYEEKGPEYGSRSRDYYN